jgi:hypothetical protein
MPRIKFTKPYAFAHQGCRTETFEIDQEVDAGDELARCAIADKVARAVKVREAKPATAPETAAADTAPETR